MFHRVSEDKIKQFYAKVEKYGGWQQVPAERIHAIFIDVLKPAEMGFDFAKRGYWARKIDADIIQVIKLDALKGGAYGLSYGLSLSYVPYPYVPKLRWHRTFKSISLDLREQPQMHLVDSRQGTADAATYTFGSMLGEKCFREELEEAWTLCSHKILAWFNSTRNFAGILEKCGEHLNRIQAGIRYVPGARLVRAFTYVKAGKLNEAKSELDIFLNEYDEGDEARKNLYSALDKVKPV